MIWPYCKNLSARKSEFHARNSIDALDSRPISLLSPKNY